MLNRTFRTLSAHTDRLNLGTRSLAIAASAFNVVAPRQSLDDRHLRMDYSRKEIGMITGEHLQVCSGVIPDSGSPPTGSATPWVSWSCQRVEVVADQPTPAGEVVPHDVRRRQRPVRTVRANAAAGRPFEAAALRAPSGAERRLLATAATILPSPTRRASRAAGG